MNPVPLDFRNTNTLWCSVLVETLARGGLQHVVISPGSRSTSLTVAFTRHAAIKAVSILDERSAAFFALGLAKRTHRPVALVCTSGTAGANYLPAVIEARESSTPLLIITADRPPEMRECASGQTIDQQKIFGSFAVFYHEYAVPEARVDRLRYLRQTTAHAFERALGPLAGPVHLNAPFRDPLPPVEDDSAASLRDQIGDDFFSHLEPAARPAPAITAWQRPTTTRGVIVAGPANPVDVSHYVTRVRAFADALGWPILADALSPLRHVEAGVAPIVAHYDAILRDEGNATALVPRQVFCLGGWPTSKVVRGWIERSGAEIVMVGGGGVNRDALHGRTRHLPVAVESLAAEGVRAADDSYAAIWRAAESAAARSLDQAFESTGELFEGKVSWLLARHLAEDTPLFIASSMPVRDVESFWPQTARRHVFYFNRGANGIDGTLSTALGVAHDADKPAVLLTGDLALLHDSNGFLSAAKMRGSLTIVLINNSGAGIFEHLPIAQFDPPFEEFFATPQQVDFGKLCEAHAVPHHVIATWEQFVAAIAESPAHGVRVLELRTDRKRDTATRKRLLAAASLAARA